MLDMVSGLIVLAQLIGVALLGCAAVWCWMELFQTAMRAAGCHKEFCLYLANRRHFKRWLAKARGE